MTVSRRDFIKTLFSSTAIAYLTTLSQLPFLLFASNKKLAGARELELQLITKLCDTLIPQTETTPSASELNVPKYIQKVMGGQIPRYRILRRSRFYRNAYEKLFLRINEISQSKFKMTFLEIDSKKALELLEVMSQEQSLQLGYRTSGLSNLETLSDSELFSMLRTHTVQGYLSDPVHGGNKDFKGWESIGYICNMNYPGDQSSCTAESSLNNQ